MERFIAMCILIILGVIMFTGIAGDGHSLLESSKVQQNNQLQTERQMP